MTPPRAPVIEYCFICPTYGHYDYARTAVESFLLHTPGSLAVVVDDGHSDFRKFWDDDWNVISHRFSECLGVTRSWNFGLIQAKERGARYTICGNDDILFTPEWYIGPKVLLDDDSVGLIGPLSNGPGVSGPFQNIWDHVPNYTVSDDPAQLAAVAASLCLRYQASDCLKTPTVNGFFMVSRTARWWEGRFDHEHVFNPAPIFAMTESEEELQKRLRQRGWRNLVSLRTFIFHYRSVTRGDRFKRGMWYRKPS